MTLVNPPAASPAAPARAPRETLGRVLAVSGAQVTIGLTPLAPGSLSRATSENSSASSAATPSSSA
jgi:hypothetical protein